MKLMILDGNSIANRAFYGVRALTAPDGTPTNAIFGFLNIFNRLMTEIAPDAVCVAFDEHEKTFRHKAFDYYKAQRKGMPEELSVQMPLLREVLTAMNVKIYTKPGYEADDILGTVGKICDEANWDCVIVTGDRDSLQLITERTSICLIKTKGGQTETTVYSPAIFKEEYGFEPARIVDLKALMGDSSDNIPGVPGVGEKTANELIKKFGGLDAVYTDINSAEIKDSVRKKLISGENSARDSFWLATILREVPLEFTPEENLWHNEFKPELYPLMLRLNFGKLIQKWNLKETAQPVDASETVSVVQRIVITDDSAETFYPAIEKSAYVSVLFADDISSFEVCNGETVYSVARADCFLSFDSLLTDLLSGKIKKVTQNLKPLMRLLLSEGLPCEGFIFDTALAGYVLASTESDYSAERLGVKFLSAAGDNVQLLHMLYPVMDKKITELGMHELYYNIELPLCRVLADMELAGFYVDRTALKDFGESLSTGIDALHESIVGHAGRDFNINSPKQLGEVLFEDLQLPYGKKTKTGWSTNADVLEKLRPFHPIIDEILDYRMLTKLKSTYADGLLKVISDDGRIHTNFQMTVTATGRLSSTEPNLQNIPIRKQLGSQIRNMFVAGKGNVLVDADYSQIELRLVAHISGDEAMRAAFLSGEDFHAVTASNVFHVPLEEVTPLLRSRAKAVNFGIIYGISSYSLSQDIGVFPKEAKAYIEAYFEEYSGVRKYLDDVVEKGRTDGYVSTMFGRRREMPELKSSNFAMREFGKRVAMNMPIQGSAADIMKLAMINVYNALKDAGLKARIVLQVHDELIVECPEDEAAQVTEILTRCMQSTADTAVPLTVEAKTGHSWGEAH